jgi:hypothetical protein
MSRRMTFVVIRRHTYKYTEVHAERRSSLEGLPLNSNVHHHFEMVASVLIHVSLVDTFSATDTFAMMRESHFISLAHAQHTVNKIRPRKNLVLRVEVMMNPVLVTKSTQTIRVLHPRS